MTSRLALLTVLVGAAFALTGCGGNSDSADSTETTSAATTAATVTETAPETTPVPTRRTITVRVVGGKPVGGIARPKIEKGEKVLLVVRSDIADEVHLHGYDVSSTIAAGGTARIAFVASIPGRFELELENTGTQLADLTVQ